jgi:uncharacterized protein
MNLKIVHGPPLSGKSAYVRERIGPNDIVYDYDEINMAITFSSKHLAERPLTHKYVIDFRILMFDRLKSETMIENAWIIVTNLTDSFKAFLDELNPEYIEIKATQEECLNRLEQDDKRPDKDAWRKIILDWFGAKEGRSKMITKDRAYRNFEVRAAPEGMTVEGYAAVFEANEVMYEIDGIQYREVIDRDAFNGAQMNDIVMNFNHQGKPVARTKNKTLEANTDDHGLHIQADLSSTAESRALYEEIKSGLIDKMSFAFTVADESYDKATHTRRIKRIKRVYDIAAVDIPAYESTSIEARSYFEAEAEKERAEARAALELALALYFYEGVK